MEWKRVSKSISSAKTDKQQTIYTAKNSMEKPTTQTPKKLENSKHETNKYPNGKSRKEFQKIFPPQRVTNDIKHK